MALVVPGAVGAALAAARLSWLFDNDSVPRPTRKKIRLAPIAYTEPGRTFSVTIGTSPRTEIFSNISFGLECVKLLREVRDTNGLLTYAYCLMPNHVHLLGAMTSRAPISVAIGAWKSRCYQAWRNRGEAKSFWQRGFYDHAVRDDHDLIAAALYVLENPARGGLVKDFHDYPLCGSMEFTL